MNDETIKDKMINYFDSQGINWKLQNAMTIFKGGIEQGKSEAIKLIDDINRKIKLEIELINTKYSNNSLEELITIKEKKDILKDLRLIKKTINEEQEAE